MPIDDPLEKSIEALAKDTRLTIPGEVVKAAIASVPIAGGAISSLLAGVMQARTLQRFIGLLEEMKELLQGAEASTGVDREFFGTEEFQTLLAIALQQLQSTHDKVKLDMLAAGLANSGTNEFRQDDRKELFLRILRDLAPQHVQLLRSLADPSGILGTAAPSLPGHRSVFRNPAGEELAVQQQLAAHGLVKEQLHPAPFRKNPRSAASWTQSEAVSALEEYLRTPPERSFQLSGFGVDFLRFLGSKPTRGES